MNVRVLTVIACCLLLPGSHLLAVNQISGHLEEVSKWLLSKVKPELEMLVGSIELRAYNSYVISDLLIRPRTDPDGECIWIERLLIEVEWQPPAGIKLKSIKAEAPYIKLGDTLLAALAGDDQQREPGPANQTEQPFLLPAVELTEGYAVLAVSHLPELQFRFTASSKKNHLTELVITQPDVRKDVPNQLQQALSFERIHMLVGHDVLATQEVAELTLDKPNLSFNQELLNKLKPAPEPQTAAAPAVGNPGAQAGSGLRDHPWLIRKLNINDGKIAISDFPQDVPVVSSNFDGSLTNFSFADEFATISHSLNFSELRVATSFAPGQPFLSMSNATLVIQPAMLMQQKISSLEVAGAKFQMDRAFRSLVQARSGTPATSSANSDGTPAWQIDDLMFADAAISLQDLGLGIPDINFTLPTASLQQVSLSGDARSASQTTENIEISDLVIYSPLDPFTPVISMPSIFIEFSLAGLMRKELMAMRILQPTIFVGPDLFWYMEELGKRPANSQPAAGGNQMDWRMQEFVISSGQLAIAFDGVNRLNLPIPFHSRASNINFSNLEELSLNIDVEVPAQDFTFPSYQLELLGSKGNIEYGLPVDSNANNVVNTFFVDQLKWRQFDATEGWLSVTYDQQGIYGNCGCQLYGGYLEGGFSFLIEKDNPWTGWAAATDVDLASITSILSPESLSIDATAALALEVNAWGPRIERVRGNMTTSSPGTLNIPKLDTLLENLPPDWTSLKRDLTRIGIDTLRNFQFDQGSSQFWFIDDHGRLKLELTGTQGSRNFDIVLHDSPLETPKLWQQTFSLQGELSKRP